MSGRKDSPLCQDISIGSCRFYLYHIQNKADSSDQMPRQTPHSLLSAKRHRRHEMIKAARINRKRNKVSEISLSAIEKFYSCRDNIINEQKPNKRVFPYSYPKGYSENYHG